jgi:hypothetical protein
MTLVGVVLPACVVETVGDKACLHRAWGLHRALAACWPVPAAYKKPLWPFGGATPAGAHASLSNPLLLLTSALTHVSCPTTSSPPYPPINRTQALKLEDSKHVAMLGSGAFGRVTLVQYEGRYYALKALSKAHVVQTGLQVRPAGLSDSAAVKQETMLSKPALPCQYPAPLFFPSCPCRSCRLSPDSLPTCRIALPSTTLPCRSTSSARSR